MKYIFVLYYLVAILLNTFSCQSGAKQLPLFQRRLASKIEDVLHKNLYLTIKPDFKDFSLSEIVFI